MFQFVSPSGNLISHKRPAVMAILNATPDSFFSASRVEQEEAWLALAQKHINEGCDILDIGGMSSRPGARVISEQEELQRVIPVIESIKKHWPNIPISVDTWRAEVASQAVNAGADLVNDISAGAMDETMFQTIAQLKAPYILMHMQGKPSTMQVAPSYQNITIDLLDFFTQKLGQLRNLGVKDILIDPGFGFGKSIDHNFQILKRLDAFSVFQCPILIGLSRKSMIYKTLNISADEALNGTSALHMAALQGGAAILRVHDVKAAVEVVTLYEAMKKA
jgi:dihydropteroate synthase